MGISRGRMVRDPVERRCLNRVFFRHRDRCDTCADAVHVDVVCTRNDVGRAQQTFKWSITYTSVALALTHAWPSPGFYPCMDFP